jgi:hypothetical protein
MRDVADLMPADMPEAEAPPPLADAAEFVETTEEDEPELPLVDPVLALLPPPELAPPPAPPPPRRLV